MTEVLHSPQSSSPSSLTCAPSSSPVQNEALLRTLSSGEEGERVEELEEVCSRVTTIADGEIKERERERDQLSLLALLLALFRKSFWIACKTDGEELSGGGMEIGWPTNVRHVAHVTFDRFNGFLGLPDEFEPEVPRRAPSASTTVFGVSTESMQMSFDSRGNSVPVILILLQRRLYAQGGLQAEGIFRINAENSQEEFVREQLNRGVVPQGIDVHCLAGLIKAWFRELPTGVLDSLSPEQVMQCRSEEDCAGLVRLLPSTEAALLGWAINLMADVVEMEHMNKMNAHNIAMVFAPNMTQMVDPLTALMYAVQVMNFLKSLITKTLRERVDSAAVGAAVSCTEPSDESGNRSPSQPSIIIQGQESASESNELGNTTDGEGGHSYSTTSMEESYEECESPKNNAHAHQSGSLVRVVISEKTPSGGVLIDQSSVVKDAVNVDVVEVQDKGKGISNLSLINSLTQRIEAWR